MRGREEQINSGELATNQPGVRRIARDGGVKMLSTLRVKDSFGDQEKKSKGGVTSVTQNVSIKAW